MHIWSVVRVAAWVGQAIATAEIIKYTRANIALMPRLSCYNFWANSSSIARIISPGQCPEADFATMP